MKISAIERVRAWRKAYPEQKRAYDRGYQKSCLRSFEHRPREMYRQIKKRLKFSKTYKNRQLLFTRQEFVDFALQNESYKRLFEQWVESGYETKLIPTVDRIENFRDYSLDNIQFLTLSENSSKGNRNRYPVLPIKIDQGAI